MGLIRIAYGIGVCLIAAGLFFCPWWWLGLIALGAGCVWAAYDLIDDGEEAPVGNVASTPGLY